MADLPIRSIDLSAPSQTAQTAVSKYKREHPAWYRQIMGGATADVPKLDTNADPESNTWYSLGKGTGNVVSKALNAGTGAATGAATGATGGGALGAVGGGLSSVGSAIAPVLPAAAGFGTVASLPLIAKGVNAWGDWVGSKIPDFMYGYTTNDRWDEYAHELGNQPEGGIPTQEGYDEWLKRQAG